MPANLNNFNRNNKFRLSKNKLKIFLIHIRMIFFPKKLHMAKERRCGAFRNTKSVLSSSSEQTRFFHVRGECIFLLSCIKRRVISDLHATCTYGNAITFISRSVRNETHWNYDFGLRLAIALRARANVSRAENSREREPVSPDGGARTKTRGNLAKAPSRLGITRANSLARARVM